MSIDIGPAHLEDLKPRIAVIGVGGAGGNAIANMIAANVEGVDFIVANTDAQALSGSPAAQRIQLGAQITQGLGAGSRPEVGRAAAEETISNVEAALDGAHMCFVAAGMGGGTGTGAAPVIAKAARDRGILTVGVVTKPFSFEGQRRMRAAEAGIAELQEHVDTLIVIPNQNLFLIASPNTTFREAFVMADEVLQQGVRGITDLMVMPGLINLDFADVRSIMREMGKAMMGTGEASGDGRALEAAQQAINNPLLDGVSLMGAKAVIVSITGGDDMRLMEVDEAVNHIRELVDEDANIIVGSAFNPALDGKIRVSVVATGIADDAAANPAPAAPTRSFSLRPAAPAPVEAAQDPDTSDALDAGTTGIGDAAADELILSADAGGDGAADTAAPLVGDAGDDGGTDELLLGADVAEPALNAPPLPEASLSPGGSLRSRLARAPAEPSEADSGGGTLFERMSRLSRGGVKPAEPAPTPDGDGPDGDGGPDIPRFLNRQNNQ